MPRRTCQHSVVPEAPFLPEWLEYHTALTRASRGLRPAYRLRAPASCVLHVPGAQGSLARGHAHCTYAVRVTASGVCDTVRTAYRGSAGTTCCTRSASSTSTPTPTPTPSPSPTPNHRYHMLYTVGVEHFYLYDDGSTDELAATLAPYVAADYNPNPNPCPYP